eukprot:CAMPEP_0172723150 /NCGR_PEP_ID=MMETSP1074-20121228/83090_1 /TAXON_ID=2916 /ORGANISM="Ceratium fusus, Strain PA161109" /LENGTH=64 /DNA_ID=CAMNT_0013549345 /DNA_START=271 /DNA_END=466 /DNA_ORIENTATION=-
MQVRPFNAAHTDVLASLLTAKPAAQKKVLDGSAIFNMYPPEIFSQASAKVGGPGDPTDNKLSKL